MERQENTKCPQCGHRMRTRPIRQEYITEETGHYKPVECDHNTGEMCEVSETKDTEHIEVCPSCSYAQDADRLEKHPSDRAAQIHGEGVNSEAPAAPAPVIKRSVLE